MESFSLFLYTYFKNIFVTNRILNLCNRSFHWLCRRTQVKVWSKWLLGLWIISEWWLWITYFPTICVGKRSIQRLSIWPHRIQIENIFQMRKQVIVLSKIGRRAAHIKCCGQSDTLLCLAWFPTSFPILSFSFVTTFKNIFHGLI